MNAAKVETPATAPAVPELLPVGKRPKCRACGRELKPNFDVKHAVKSVQKYTRPSFVHGQRPIEEGDIDAKQDAKGRWYVTLPVRSVVARIFKGTYGAYRDGMFCGLNCARTWAVNICAMLEKKGEFWITYKEKK